MSWRQTEVWCKRGPDLVRSPGPPLAGGALAELIVASVASLEECPCPCRQVLQGLEERVPNPGREPGTAISTLAQGPRQLRVTRSISKKGCDSHHRNVSSWDSEHVTQKQQTFLLETLERQQKPGPWQQTPASQLALSEPERHCGVSSPVHTADVHCRACVCGPKLRNATCRVSTE